MYCVEGQRLYLKAWEYNTCRMLGALAEIVRNNGGIVAEAPYIMANNRTYEPDAEPKRIYGRGYIKFTLDGFLYYFQVDENPFFDHGYTKRKIHDGKVVAGCNTYIEDLSRDWIYDCLFAVTNDADIREIAEQVFTLLITAKPSRIARTTHRRKVPAHWEYYGEPVRYEEVKL